MYQTGKLAQVTAEMRRYKLYVLVMSESRWTVSGRQTTTIRETVLHPGCKDNQSAKTTNTTRNCQDPKKGRGDVTAGVEAGQQLSDESQAKREAHQHHTDPVLPPNK